MLVDLLEMTNLDSAGLVVGMGGGGGGGGLWATGFGVIGFRVEG